jgi:cytochrome b pre-mRNA-processing protein 3
MDHSFREMGIGDLAVPKHMRGVAEAFYGRAAAYEEAIERGEAELAAVLARNIFPEVAASAACARRMAVYVRAAIDQLERHDAESFARARVSFPDPEVIAAPPERGEEKDR